MADGGKWFESQAYVASSRNIFKRVRVGDVLFFGTGDAVFGAALVSSEAVRVDAATARTLLAERLVGAASEKLRAEFDGYLDGRGRVDYVLFDVVWDLRLLGLSWEVLIRQRLQAQPPQDWQGLRRPAGEAGKDAPATRAADLEHLWALPGVVRRAV